MIDITTLSRIGFGSYRVSPQVKEHYRALVHALQSGCNLIDTASTYGYGKSERLIGKVLRDYPAFDPFLITKAGYVTHTMQAAVRSLVRAGNGAEVDTMPQGWQHCIHPDFLRIQLAASLRRLRRPFVDGFLLHNPEYYYSSLAPDSNSAAFYQRIERAFTFLEEQVAKGLIRYYGISSNTLPLSTSATNTLNLRRLVAVAEKVSTKHHFRLIQFPYNLYESGAAQPNQDGQSLLALAKAHNIITLGNRPLNATSEHGVVRLASYEQQVACLDPAHDAQLVARVIQRISARLDAMGADPSPASYTALDFLQQSWQQLPDPTAAAGLVQDHLHPFLHLLYEGRVPAADQQLLRQLKKVLVAHSFRQLQARHLPHRAALLAASHSPANDARTSSVVACAHYLQTGIDHVLVGMRKPGYVDSLSHLF